MKNREVHNSINRVERAVDLELITSSSVLDPPGVEGDVWAICKIMKGCFCQRDTLC
jgi:hypothetical protein